MTPHVGGLNTRKDNVNVNNWFGSEEKESILNFEEYLGKAFKIVS